MKKQKEVTPNFSPVKIVPYDEMFSYNQDPQYKYVGFSYAHLDGDKVHQLNGYFVCRDFLGDALFAEEQKRLVQIYGFKWNPEKEKVDRDKTRLLLQMSSEEMVNNFTKNITIINEIEKENELDLTIVRETDGELELFTEGDSRWQASVVLISLYSFLLKSLSYPISEIKDIESYYGNGSNEGRLAHQCLEKLPKILKNLKRFGFDEESKKFPVSGTKDKSITGTVHHHSGWWSVTLPSKSAYKENPYIKIVKEICGG